MVAVETAALAASPEQDTPKGRYPGHIESLWQELFRAGCTQQALHDTRPVSLSALPCFTTTGKEEQRSRLGASMAIAKDILSESQPSRRKWVPYVDLGCRPMYDKLHLIVSRMIVWRNRLDRVVSRA
jgi:hypothetical protein